MLAAGSSGVDLRQRGLLVGRLREFAGAERMTGLIAAPTQGCSRPSPEWPPQMAAASVVSLAVAPVVITRLGRRAFPQGSSAMLTAVPEPARCRRRYRWRPPAIDLLYVVR